MSSLLQQLPLEVRKKIFELCEKRDLANVVLCSRFWYKEVVPVLWYQINVTWRDLAKKDIDTKTANLRFTRKLSFDGKKENAGYKSFAFAFLVRNCDPVRLTSFSVSSYMVPDGLQLVAEKLPNLRHLSLSGGILGARLDLLSQFQLLERLSLDFCQVTDHQVQEICKLRNLRALRLHDYFRAKVTSKSLEYIGNLVELKELFFSMENDVANKESLNRTIPKLKSLVHIELPYSNIDVEAFRYSSSLRRQALEVLNITGSKLSGLVLPAIFKFHNLKRLNLSDCDKFSDEGFETIHQLHQLEHLYLDGSNITDEAVRHVSKLLTLRRLTLFACVSLTDTALQLISQLKLLDSLNIGFNDNYTDKGVSYLTSLQNLRYLGMCALGVTEKSLQFVSKLCNLRRLDISRCAELTDDGLLHLTNNPYLNVDCCDCEKLTVEGMKKAEFYCF